MYTLSASRKATPDPSTRLASHTYLSLGAWIKAVPSPGCFAGSELVIILHYNWLLDYLFPQEADLLGETAPSSWVMQEPSASPGKPTVWGGTCNCQRD